MRPDQIAAQVRGQAGTGPAAQNTVFIGRLVVIFGTGATSGMFVYSGSPALGNPPVDYVTAPGVTYDPYNNALPATTGGFISARYSGGVAQALAQLNSGQLVMYAGPPASYFEGANIGVNSVDGQSLILSSAVLSSGAAAFLELVTAASGDPYVLVGNLTTLLVASVGPPSTTAVGEFHGAVAAEKLLISPTLAAALTGAQAEIQGALAVTSGGASITGGETVDNLNVGGGKAGNVFAVGAGSSDFTGPVFIEDQGAPATPGTSAAHYSLAGQHHYVDEQGNDNQTGSVYFRSTGNPQNVTSNVAAPLAGITGETVAAGTYYVRGVIFGTMGATAAGATIGFVGPAATTSRIGWRYIEGNTLFGSGIVAIGGAAASGVIPLGTSFEFYFEGTIVFSAGGSTFGLTVAESTAGDSWSVLLGSVLVLSRIG